MTGRKGRWADECTVCELCKSFYFTGAPQKDGLLCYIHVAENHRTSRDLYINVERNKSESFVGGVCARHN